MNRSEPVRLEYSPPRRVSDQRWPYTTLTFFLLLCFAIPVAGFFAVILISWTTD